MAACLLTRGALCRSCGACHRARSTAPTVLAREMRRSALRPPRSAIVRLRSGAVASRSGAFRIAAFRCGGGGPRGWHGRASLRCAVSLRHRATAFHPAHGIHPRMRLAWLGRDASRRPATPPRGVCRARAADCAPAPLAAAPPLARCRHMPFSARRKRSACTAYMSHFCALRNLKHVPCLFEREAWHGGGGTRRSKRGRRDAAGDAGADADATGGIPTKRSAPLPADAWRALRRTRAR